MTELVLIGAGYSVYSRVARICLKEKKLVHDFREIDIFDADVRQDHLALHPFGKIPVLLHGSRAVIETAAIIRYLDAAFPPPALQPVDAADLARAEQTIEVVNAYAYQRLVWDCYVPWSRAGDSGAAPAPTADETAKARACLQFFESRLDQSAWFAGPDFGAADAFVFPLLDYFRRIPRGAAQMRDFKDLAAWFERAARRPAVAATGFPREATRTG